MKEKTPIENKNLHNIKEAPPGIARTEQEAWKEKVLGTQVEVKPLPNIVTPEVRRNLEGMGFGLRYIPALDLGSLKLLRELGVDRYLADLQRKYPKWKSFESLSDREQTDYTVPRNLGRWYWESVNDGRVTFPVLPGQWMAVETVYKPLYREKYARRPLAERLGFLYRSNISWIDPDTVNVSWTVAHTAIEREKPRILSDIGVSGRSVDLRLLEALEWNLLGNREGWGKTDISEWTNTEFRGPGSLRRRLIVGDFDYGGAAYVGRDHPDISGDHIGFRAAVVLGS